MCAFVKFLCKQQREHIRDVFVTVSGMVFLLPAVCPTGLLVSLELLCVKAGGLRLTACTTQLFLRSALQMLQNTSGFVVQRRRIEEFKGLSASQIVRIDAVIYRPKKAVFVFFLAFLQRPLRPV